MDFGPAFVLCGSLLNQYGGSNIGTGIRGSSSIENVDIKIGGVDAQASFAGAQGMPGLDQVNIPLLSSHAGLGEVDLKLSVDGRSANPVRINIQ